MFQLSFQDGVKLKKHEHDPGRLIRHLEAYSGFPVRFEPTYQLLGVKSGEISTAMFHLSDQPIGSCFDEYDVKDFEDLNFNQSSTD